jgi:hypothetical protein
VSERNATQDLCGANDAAAESGQGRAARVIAEPPRTTKRRAAKVAASTKADPGPGEDRGAESAAAEVVGKSSGRTTATAKDSENTGAVPSDDVKSVEELARAIRRDPEKRKKRLKLAEAVREYGLDEAKVAELLHALAAKLSQNKEIGAVGVANAKLLLDVLKEITHVLEPQRAVGNSDSSDAPQFVRLIHNVPRPVRTE